MPPAHERVLKQERLDDDDPQHYSKVFEIRRLLKYKIDPATNGLIFWYEDDGSTPPVPPVNELNIDVVDDSEIYLRLSDDRPWRWSRNFDAITLKKQDKKYYGTVKYKMPDNSFEEWDGTSPKTWDCKAISFLAAKNTDAPNNKTHGFSLNIDLILPGGEVLPITLDPDIQNPKPPEPDPIRPPLPGVLFAR